MSQNNHLSIEFPNSGQKERHTWNLNSQSQPLHHVENDDFTSQRIDQEKNTSN